MERFRVSDRTRVDELTALEFDPLAHLQRIIDLDAKVEFDALVISGLIDLEIGTARPATLALHDLHGRHLAGSDIRAPKMTPARSAKS